MLAPVNRYNLRSQRSRSDEPDETETTHLRVPDPPKEKVEAPKEKLEDLDSIRKIKEKNQDCCKIGVDRDTSRQNKRTRKVSTAHDKKEKMKPLPHLCGTCKQFIGARKSDIERHNQQHHQGQNAIVQNSAPNCLHLAKGWVESQIKLLEGTIIFIGGLYKDSNDVKMRMNDTTPKQKNEKLATLEKFDEIKVHAYNLLRRNSHSVKNVLTFMLSGGYKEPGGAHRMQQMAQDVVQNLAEISQFFFAYMPSEGTRLYKKMDPNFNVNDAREKWQHLDPWKKIMKQKIANATRQLGLETEMDDIFKRSTILQ